MIANHAIIPLIAAEPAVGLAETAIFSEEFDRVDEKSGINISRFPEKLPKYLHADS